MTSKTIEVGQLVHWYKYSSDMIIVDGGWGTVVEVNLNFCLVLTNEGIQEIPNAHCDIEETEWDS